MYKQFIVWLLLFAGIRSHSQAGNVFKDKTFSFTLEKAWLDDSSTCTIKTITIRRLSDNAVVQVITPGDNTPLCDSDDGGFYIEDMNFDGKSDIRLMQFLPAGPNVPYYYWFYNAKTNQFEPNSLLEEITSPEFDGAKKLIYSSWRDGCCHHGRSTYKYANGKLVLIEETDAKITGNKQITTIRKLVAGKMKMVKKSVEKAEE